MEHTPRELTPRGAHPRGATTYRLLTTVVKDTSFKNKFHATTCDTALTHLMASDETMRKASPPPPPLRSNASSIDSSTVFSPFLSVQGTELMYFASNVPRTRPSCESLESVDVPDLRDPCRFIIEPGFLVICDAMESEREKRKKTIMWKGKKESNRYRWLFTGCGER